MPRRKKIVSAANPAIAWISWLFHLETLFYIFIILLVIYLIIYGKEAFKSITLPTISSKQIEDALIYKSKKPKKINQNEEECRKIFKKIFGVPFLSVRPDWLKNTLKTNGKNLELDGFNPTIKTPIGYGLAFEYDGIQHAEYSPYYHRKGPEEFEYQYNKDRYKDECCKNNRVMLIRIPHTVQFHDLERYITEKLIQKGVLGDG